MTEYGIPYMGSKDKIARSIISFLPKAENLYDLFGGGFAITHCAMTFGKNKYNNFIYNEIKPGNAILIRDSIEGKYNYDVFKPEYITREEFHKRKSHDPYVAILWSFGNSQTTYLFGEHIEKQKESLHNAVVFGLFDEFAKTNLKLSKWPNGFDDIKKRRLYVRQRLKNDLKMNALNHLQNLERSQRLERLQQLNLQLNSKSYEEIEIKNNSVIYCDIPYEGTAGYGNSFDRKKFLDWAHNINHPVYISEYQVKDNRFELVYKIDKRSMLCATDKSTVKVEKLYWNRKEINYG